MSIEKLIEWVQAEHSRAWVELVAADRNNDDVRWAVAWHRAECLSEIETILHRAKEEQANGHADAGACRDL